MLTVIVCGDESVDVLGNMSSLADRDIKKIAVLNENVVNSNSGFDKYIFLGDCIDKIQKSKGRMEVSYSAETTIQERLSHLLVDSEIVMVAGFVKSEEDVALFDNVSRILRMMGILNIGIIGVNNKNIMERIIYKAHNKKLSQQFSAIFEVEINELREKFEQIILSMYDMIHFNGVFNLNVGDLYKIFNGGKSSYIVHEEASGDNRGKKVIEKALDNQGVKGKLKIAENVLINITGNKSLALYEIKSITEAIYKEVNEDAGIIFGTLINDRYKEDIKIAMIIN